MNEQEQIQLRVVADRLKPVAEALIEAGWQAELIVFAPSEIKRVPGFKVALVVPLSLASGVQQP